MTERPSQTKQIIEMLGVINERLARIETKVEYQPKVDEQRFVNLEKSEVACKQNFDKQIQEHEDRLVSLESKPSKRWETIVSAGIGSVVGAIVGFLFKQ